MAAVLQGPAVPGHAVHFCCDTLGICLFIRSSGYWNQDRPNGLQDSHRGSTGRDLYDDKLCLS